MAVTVVPEMQFLGAAEVMACVGVGRSKAYQIIQQLNAELEQEGYLTFPGKVPARRFQERLYTGSPIATKTAGKADRSRTSRPRK